MSLINQIINEELCVAFEKTFGNWYKNAQVDSKKKHLCIFNLSCHSKRSNFALG